MRKKLFAFFLHIPYNNGQEKNLIPSPPRSDTAMEAL